MQPARIFDHGLLGLALSLQVSVSSITLLLQRKSVCLQLGGQSCLLIRSLSSELVLSVLRQLVKLGLELNRALSSVGFLVLGTLLTRRLGDRQIVVKVLTDGFEYESRRYRSLSAIAREVTGTRWNGLLFFGLAERRDA